MQSMLCLHGCQKQAVAVEAECAIISNYFSQNSRVCLGVEISGFASQFANKFRPICETSGQLISKICESNQRLTYDLFYYP